MNVVKHHFRPEFLNRLDEIVMFSKLSLKEIKHILDLQIKEIEKLLKPKRISLRLYQTAHDFILKEAYDPKYGARPIRRYLQKHLVTVLSKLYIDNQLTNNCLVHIQARDNQLTFRVEPND